MVIKNRRPAPKRREPVVRERHVVHRLTVIVEGVVKLSDDEEPDFARLMLMPPSDSGHYVTTQPTLNAGGQLEMIRRFSDKEIRIAVTDIEPVHDHIADDQSDFRKRDYWKEQW